MLCERICVGTILKPVGIKGQVKIHSYTSSPSDIIKFSSLFLSNNTKIVLVSPVFMPREKDKLLCFIQGYEGRNHVEKLRFEKLFVAREHLSELNEDEYYFNDLKNLEVINEKQESIGKVKEVFDYGAGTFLELIIDDKIATLPFNKNAVLQVDLKNSTITVNSLFILN